MSKQWSVYVTNAELRTDLLEEARREPYSCVAKSRYSYSATGGCRYAASPVAPRLMLLFRMCVARPLQALIPKQSKRAN